MDDARWFGRYRAVFFSALAVTLLWQLYRISGFAPELVDRVSGRLPGRLDIDPWLARIGAAAYVLTLAAGAAILISLASRAYERLARPDDR
jgi:hypothetical protein